MTPLAAGNLQSLWGQRSEYVGASVRECLTDTGGSCQVCSEGVRGSTEEGSKGSGTHEMWGQSRGRSGVPMWSLESDEALIGMV